MKDKLQTFCAAFLLISISATAQQATLMFNEINPNISSSHDLIELVAVSGGSINAFTIEQGISTVVTLAALPQVNVAAGDIIVVHLNPATATGAAPGSEMVSKNEYATSLYSANYDNAWDLHGGATGITFSNRVMLLKDSAGNIQDAVAFTNNGGVPAAYPGDVTTIQGQNLWQPADCSGSPCTYASAPTVEAISVNWQGSGTTVAGNTAQRISNTDTDMNSDWTPAPQASTWGNINAGQTVSVPEEKNNIKVFILPNPVVSSAIIYINEKIEGAEMKIFDVTGREVKQLKLQPGKTIFEKDNLQRGIYFCAIISGTQQAAYVKFAID